MHCDVITTFVICISNKIKYLEVQFCMKKMERGKQHLIPSQDAIFTWLKSIYFSQVGQQD